MSKEIIFFYFFLFNCLFLLGQNRTVGVLKTENGLEDRFILFNSIDNTEVYLIDGCGALINNWSTGLVTSTPYLIPDGKLLLASKVVNSEIWGRPGFTGKLEIFDWENTTLWSTEIYNSKYGLHHDLEYLPNGNILAIAWEQKSKTEMIEMGRDSSKIENDVWPTTILEIQPVGTDTFNIVWEWHLADHLIQDFDSTKANFGKISDHPELLDINIITRWEDDWVHANSMYYDANRDQIILSARSFDEIWIIDHSTSTEEAASHTGGNSNKGGDFLFRWGNPSNYIDNFDGLKYFDGQHDARIQNDGSITIFNNNLVSDSSSTLLKITAVRNDDGTFEKAANGSYLPEAPDFVYADATLFDSDILSSFEILENGHFLIADGNSGTIIELNEEKESIFEYVIPISLFGIIDQGDTTVISRTYKIQSYQSNDSIFTNIELSPKRGAIENNTTIGNLCEVTSIDSNNEDFEILVYPNPANEILNVVLEGFKNERIQIFNANGKEVLNTNKLSISLESFNTGLYYLKVRNKVEKFVIIKSK